MYIKSYALSEKKLDDTILKNDKLHCRKFGPCGVGKQAVYLNSFYLDRIYYVPFEQVTRIFKRVAMSKGGFTGKGLFASIPYLVVEYDNGKQKQCQFKDERQVDELLNCLRQEQPQIPLISEAARARLEERRQQKLQREEICPTQEEAVLIKELQHEIDYLERKPELYEDLSHAAKKKRNYQFGSPGYRWVAMIITLMGSVSLIYGIRELLHAGTFAIYFTLFGIAAIFLFAGFSVLPTARNNRSYIWKHYKQALDAMETNISRRKQFAVPARYAHPIVLKWMQRSIGKHRASTFDEALGIVKEDLKALTPEVEVEQEEYEEVLAIKPLFTVADYE